MKKPYFDIEWIIDLIQQQEPDRTDLIEQSKSHTERKGLDNHTFILYQEPDQINQVQNGNLKRTLFWNMKVKEQLSSTHLKTVESVELSL